MFEHEVMMIREDAKRDGKLWGSCSRRAADILFATTPTACHVHHGKFSHDIQMLSGLIVYVDVSTANVTCSARMVALTLVHVARHECVYFPLSVSRVLCCHRCSLEEGLPCNSILLNSLPRHP